MIPGLYFLVANRPESDSQRAHRHREAARLLKRRQPPSPIVPRRDEAASDVAIRWARAADASSLRRVAALDSQRAPTGPALVAERDGTLVAALELSDGRVLANPFVPTADVVGLLELRASQLGARRARHDHRPLRRRLRGAVAAGA